MTKMLATFKEHPIKTSIKWFFYSIVIFVYVFFTIRILTMQADTDFLWNKTTRDAYNASPEDFTVLSAGIRTSLADDGKFAIYDVYYVPTAKQLQFTIRYNNSTVEDLKAKLGVKKNDDFPEEPFFFVLRTYVYNKETKVSEVKDIIYEYTYSPSKSGRYHDRVIIFENVDLVGSGNVNDVTTWDVTHAYVDPYFVKDVDLSLQAYGYPLLAFEKEMGVREFDFKSTLKNNNPQSSGGFVKAPEVKIKGTQNKD